MRTEHEANGGLYNLILNDATKSDEKKNTQSNNDFYENPVNGVQSTSNKPKTNINNNLKKMHKNMSHD